MTGLLPGPVPGEVLLLGVVGSTAYGLTHAGSDVDRLGVFAAPPLSFGEMHPPPESVVFKAPDPDVTLHEARKSARLMLGCNPTVLEVLWLPAELYQRRHPIGEELIGIRSAFLSARRVRDAYIGYAVQQFRRLETRGDGSFSADTRARTAKHARHLARLCWQGLHLYRTGELPIRMDNPDGFHRFGEVVAERGPDAARAILSGYESAFSDGRTVLPAEPDRAAVGAWLAGVRRSMVREALAGAGSIGNDPGE